MNNHLIKVGFCIAYDWNLLQYSLPLIYKEADVICLSIDKDRISWTGNPFSWDEEGFRKLVKDIDVDDKIKVLEEDYHLPELQPMQNEVRQRNSIATFMGKTGWHIQLDTDEFFLNFKGFKNYLLSLKPKRKVNISCPWITLFKQDENGFYYVKPKYFSQVEYMEFATLWPAYKHSRRNDNFNILTSFAVLHLSWARSEAEVREKLYNWGHSKDFNVEEYFNQWKNLNIHNYTEYENFHHLKPDTWPTLDFIKAGSIEELLKDGARELLLPIKKIDLRLKNSIWFSRLKKILGI